ncbi:basic helix-loop-helix domain-containing protein [Endozoicomonas numazuensis]|uniref:BHLH domain-containing protein n=1 Tax=Endozoicomonas numazuensis TaxID=1137799 RepID=A0A081MZZ6_9GAMM|nr:basic helix-loop-helix domain-containing protein [Endozoicomonas numazuensis]KEQ11769.1 hypothetical protein GZ78_28360 [Endozoicomonas numazuensis]
MIPTSKPIIGSKQDPIKMANSARERQRVSDINKALDTLRQKIPEGGEKLSKVEVIRGVTRYIKDLQEVSRTMPESSLGPSTPFTPIQLHHMGDISTSRTVVQKKRCLSDDTDALNVSFADPEVKEGHSSSSKRPHLNEDQPDRPLLVKKPYTVAQLVDEQESLSLQIRELSNGIDDIGAQLAAMDQLSNETKREAIDCLIQQLEEVKASIPVD